MQSSSQEPSFLLWMEWLGRARANSYFEVNPALKLEQLALWNQKISASFMSDVAHVEIALRNALNGGLTRRLEKQGESCWFSEALSSFQN